MEGQPRVGVEVPAPAYGLVPEPRAGMGVAPELRLGQALDELDDDGRRGEPVTVPPAMEGAGQVVVGQPQRPADVAGVEP